MLPMTNAHPDLLLVEQSTHMMGTDVSIHLSVAPADKEKARHALERGMDWLRRVERGLTRFDPQSELCQLNAAAGRWMPVSPLLFTAVEAAIAGAKASDGL